LTISTYFISRAICLVLGPSGLALFWAACCYQVVYPKQVAASPRHQTKQARYEFRGTRDLQGLRVSIQLKIKRVEGLVFICLLFAIPGKLNGNINGINGLKPKRKSLEPYTLISHAPGPPPQTSILLQFCSHSWTQIFCLLMCGKNKLFGAQKPTGTRVGYAA
jgi:hypothetical protein